MTTTVHPNSINAYHGINLTKKQSEVVRALEILGCATDQQLADYLNYTTNRITGRITELTNKGVVIEYDRVIGDFGKPVRVNKLKEIQGTLF